jgi:hypothetical protein
MHSAITDVHRAAGMTHAMGAQIFVDAVHWPPHQLVDGGDGLRLPQLLGL